MAKTCITEKTAQRQRWIEDGLLELMLRSKFEAITVTDLCQYLGLSRRSFYRYFHDLEDVLDSLLHHTFQEFAISSRFVTVQELQKNYDFWLKRKDLLKALISSGLSSKITEFTLQYTDETSILPCLDDNDLGMDIRRETRLFIINGSVSLMVAWYGEGFQKTPEQMAQITHRMLTQPILRNR